MTDARGSCHPEASALGEQDVFADIAHESIARVECPGVVFSLVSYPCLVRGEIGLALGRECNVEDIFGQQPFVFTDKEPFYPIFVAYSGAIGADPKSTFCIKHYRGKEVVGQSVFGCLGLPSDAIEVLQTILRSNPHVPFAGGNVLDRSKCIRLL